MTCQELYDSLTPEQRQTDLVVFDPYVKDYFPCQLRFTPDMDDVLDENSPYLVICYQNVTRLVAELVQAQHLKCCIRKDV